MKKFLFKLSTLHLIGILGLSISIFQIAHFYSVQTGAVGFESICKFGAFDCVAVERSPYAQILGMPVAAYAAGWFLAIFVISLLAASGAWRREALRFLKLMGFAGALVAAAFLSVMIGELKTLCVLCLAIDALLVLTLVVILALKPEPLGEGELDRGRWKKLTIGLIACETAALGLTFLAAPMPFSPQEMERVLGEILAGPRIEIPKRDRPTLGSTKPVITVTKFSDFQCPACQKGAFALHGALENDVQFVFRNFPLDHQCNRFIPQAMHPVACEAARAALCAWKQGKFEAFYRQVFQHQSELKAGAVAAWLPQFGIDPTQYERCMSDQATHALLQEDIEDGGNLQVMSTPTFFVNGYKIEGGLTPELWKLLFARLRTQGAQAR